MTGPVDVLVAGAGPAGLSLALQAHAHGARVRVVERRPEQFRPSRALIVHPRTLEVLRPLGITGQLLDRTDITPHMHLHLGRRVVAVALAGLALPDTAFPHLSLLRQADVESVLSRALLDRGVEVQRGAELVGLCQDADTVHATVRGAAGTEQIACTFLAGCDGPASTVRGQAGIGWSGGPYAEEVLLADAELDGELPGSAAHAVPLRHGLLFLFPAGERATWRLLTTRPATAGDGPPFGALGAAIPVSELQAILDQAGLRLRITRLAWSARCRVQHRLAARFRQGRVFLAGEAAHAYSPAGGQGMNAGIQDAMNLGWKLAFAASGNADPALLDSYQAERRPVARRLIVLTHLIYRAEAATGPIPSWLRGAAVPLTAPALPLLLSRPQLLAAMIRTLSQLRVGYRRSPLTREATPRIRGLPRAGDRLPDATVTCQGRQARLHELLARPGLHLLLQRDAGHIEDQLSGSTVVTHRLTSAPGRGIIAVRPDGYIGFRCAAADLAQLRDWLARLGACPPQPPAPGGAAAGHAPR